MVGGFKIARGAFFASEKAWFQMPLKVEIVESIDNVNLPLILDVAMKLKKCLKDAKAMS